MPRPPRPNAGFATIGYEGRSLDDVVALLVSADVDVLVDVRQNAVSRKPGLSKRRLRDAVEGAGIRYVHEPLLGNPRENRDSFRSGEMAARDHYLAHLNNGSRQAYDRVVDLAREQRVALLCFESDHSTCHRSCITDQALDEQPGLDVVLL